MFIAHFGVGFGAKSLAPRTSLGTIFLATQFADLLWPTLLVAGIEHVQIDPGATVVTPLNFVSYPISHSLAMIVMWGAVFGSIYWMLRRNTRSSIVLGLGVVSHWLLDLIVHRPDLPLIPGASPKVGLGLWNSLPATLLIEAAVFAVGLWLYTRSTQPRNRLGTFSLSALAILLVLIYGANVFGPPPPDVNAIAWAGHLQWLLVVFAYWVDRTRTVVLRNGSR